MSVSDQPSSAAELISWFLANGYSMTEIRGMFPAFFLSDPAPALVWNAVDWLRHWDSCGAMAALDSGFQECFDFTPTP